MQIEYHEIDAEHLAEFSSRYGEMVTKHIHLENDSYSLAAMCHEVPVGLISTYTRALDEPLGEEKDAYIDIIEVDEAYRRMGIATELIRLTEEWAKHAGLLQIRAWSSRDKSQAIQMWRRHGYGLCPARIWLDWCNKAMDGYYVVKSLNPLDPYPHITQCIQADLRDETDALVHGFRLIGAKQGIRAQGQRSGDDV